MNNKSKSLKIGLIGCGNVAENRHLPALRSLRDGEVVAVADIDLDRLKRVADKFQIGKRYSDFRALVRDPAVEAVAICVPTQFHVEMALAALEAGKHLFIEKPLALSLDEADRLIERAAHSPCKVMVGFNLRWHRLVRQAREMIQQGTLGPLELIVSVFTTGIRYRQRVSEWKRRRELGGGVLVENAIHYFDLWRFLLQSEIEEVFAISRSEQWDDLTATVTARMANGVIVASVFSESTSEHQEMQLYGQAGHLHLSLYRFDGLKFLPPSTFPGDIRTRLQDIAHFLKESPGAIVKARQGGDLVLSFRTQWEHFIDSIRRDEPTACTLEDGRRTLEAALAAVESASLRKPVKVSQAPHKITSIASNRPVESQQKYD